MKQKILNTVLASDQIAFFYLGQEGYIFKSGDHYLMIDGYLSGPMYSSDNLRGRLYAPPIQPEELDFLDIVMVTHDHLDHTDPVTLKAVAEHNEKAVFIVPAPFVKNVISYGVPEERIIPAFDGRKITFPFASVTPVPSAHEELRQDENGDYYDMGYVLDLQGTRIYHSGDCCIYDGMTEKIGTVDISMLPINGRSYYRLKDNIIGNMNLEESLLLTKEINAGFYIPMHFDLFAWNAVPAAYIPPAIDMYAPGMKYKIFLPGERMIYSK